VTWIEEGKKEVLSTKGGTCRRATAARGREKRRAAATRAGNYWVYPASLQIANEEGEGVILLVVGGEKKGRVKYGI